MERRPVRLPLAILLAAGAAAAATLILRPRSGLIEPAAVDVKAYFSAAELARAEAFRDPQRLIGLAGLALTGGTLAFVAFGSPRRLLEPLGRRRYLGAAAAGAGISVALVAVRLPLSAVAHKRSRDYGLATQDWGPWLADLAKYTAVDAAFAAAGGALALAVVSRFRRHWWAPMAVGAVAIGFVTLWLFPVVIDPLFNRFEPLPRGELRSDVLELARRSGVDVGEVYRVDASRRTTGANAYVVGFGHTKRVVLYDNLIEEFPPAELRSVVAHELGHQRHRDLWRGLAWLALVAPAATFLAQRFAERFEPALTDRRVRPGPAALPALALALGLVSFAGGIASNVLSRRVEAAADAFALRLTDDPRAFIGLERSLAITNVSDPDPPRITHVLFGTHPTIRQRIGFGVTYARDGG
jgi:STE24 endopeptidase